MSNEESQMRREKILNHAKDILKDCEERNYTNSEVALLIYKLGQIKDEAVQKEKFQTHSFEGFYYCNCSQTKS